MSCVFSTARGRRSARVGPVAVPASDAEFLLDEASHPGKRLASLRPIQGDVEDFDEAIVLGI